MNDNLERTIKVNITLTIGIPCREEIENLKNEDETIDEYEEGHVEIAVHDLRRLVEMYQNYHTEDLMGLSDICDIQYDSTLPIDILSNSQN